MRWAAFLVAATAAGLTAGAVATAAGEDRSAVGTVLAAERYAADRRTLYGRIKTSAGNAKALVRLRIMSIVNPDDG